MKKILAAVTACIITGSAVPVSMAAYAEEDTTVSDTQQEEQGIYFTAESFDTYIKITGYTGTAEAVAIPSEVNGIPVTTIGKLECDGPIGNLVLPASITEIEDGAFDNITGLTAIDVAAESESFASVDGVLYNKDMTKLILYPYGKQETSYVIPDTVTEIAPNAMKQIIALEELTIGAGLTAVDGNTFSGCASLSILNIPASVETIDLSVIREESALKEINVAEENAVYSSDNGILFNKDASELICYPSAKGSAGYAVPSTVTSIADYAFAGSKLYTVTIADSVTSIGTGAFSSMENLTTAVIGSGVVSIGESAFSGDSALISIIINSAEMIEADAFAGCTSLSTIELPVNTAIIAPGVFDTCSSLASIKVDEDNESYAAFDGVLFNKTVDTLIKYPSGKKASSYMMPDSVIVIEDNAFYNCTPLDDISFGTSFAGITGTPFSGSTALLNYYVSVENQTLASISGVLFTKDGKELLRYPNGRRAGEYIVPESAVSFSKDAFSDNQNITGFVVPESSESLSAVDGVVFSKDGSVLIKYPNAAERDFYEVPESVESVAANAFESAVNLEGLSFLNSEIQIAADACSNVNSRFVIYGNYDSTAKTFAAENNYEFIAIDLDYAFGDVSGDGNVDALDASDILTVYAATATGHRSKFIPAQEIAADVEPDGAIDALDASRVLTYYSYTATTEGERLSVCEYFGIDDPTTPEDETPVVEEPAYKAAYKEIIESLSDDENVGFNLIYFNDDDIPELVAGHDGYYQSLYTFSDGNVYTLMDQWAYGAMGNTGYAYVPEANSLKNYNSDYAGLVGYTTYMAMNDAFELEEVVVIETHNYEDLNGNGTPDEDEFDTAGNVSVSYIDGAEVTPEECAAYEAGDYIYISAPMTLDEIMAALGE